MKIDKDLFFIYLIENMFTVSSRESKMMIRYYKTKIEMLLVFPGKFRKVCNKFVIFSEYCNNILVVV